MVWSLPEGKLKQIFASDVKVFCLEVATVAMAMAMAGTLRVKNCNF